MPDPFPSFDAAEEWVDTWSASVTELAARSQALADRVAAMTSTASSADQAVRVTVDGSGTVTDLRLDDRIVRRSGADVAGEILAVMRRAQSGLANLVAEAARETVGLDTDTGLAIVEGFERRTIPGYIYPAAYPRRHRCRRC